MSITIRAVSKLSSWWVYAIGRSLSPCLRVGYSWRGLVTGQIEPGITHVFFFSKIVISLTQHFSCAQGRLHSFAKWKFLVSTLLEHDVPPQFWFHGTWTNASKQWPTVKVSEMRAIPQLVVAPLNPILAPYTCFLYLSSIRRPMLVIRTMLFDKFVSGFI